MQKLTVFRYEVSYTGVSPGLQRLYGRGSDVNNHILHVLRMREYAHSQYPFTMTACSDPTQLSLPVRVITDLNGPQLVLMVLYMYVMGVMNEFRFSDFLLFIFYYHQLCI